MRAAGAIEAALASYAAAGAYDKLFETAGQAGAGVLAKYLYPRAAELLSTGGSGAPPSAARGVEVLGYLERYGAPPEVGALPIYTRLCRAIFPADSGHAWPPPRPLLTRLRDVLYKLVAALRKGPAGANPVGTALSEFEHCLLAVHYAEMRCVLEELNGGGGGGGQCAELVARCAATLLRFTDLLPADAAYHDAGCAARAAGDKGGALVLLNRFIDLSGALEEGESSSAGVDDGGAECRHAGWCAPGAFPLPPRPYVSPRAREEANTWVLATSMDRKVSAALAVRACGGCGGKVPACALVCPACTSITPACVVTGAPIAVAAQEVQCGGCGSKAAAVAWAALVGKTRTCCWCACPAK
jgi:intraflagellar transport protein 172